MSNINANFLHLQDPDFDQVIWGRSLLDRTMAILTQMAREEVTKNASTGKDSLRQDRSNASQLWRQFLQNFSKYPANQQIPETEANIDNTARYNIAVQILTSYAKTDTDNDNDTDNDTDDRNNIIYIDGIPTIPKSALAALVVNVPAMKLLTERQSPIRNAGNRFAHSLPRLKFFAILSADQTHICHHMGDSRLGHMWELLIFWNNSFHRHPFHRHPHPYQAYLKGHSQLSLPLISRLRQLHH